MPVPSRGSIGSGEGCTRPRAVLARARRRSVGYELWADGTAFSALRHLDSFENLQLRQILGSAMLGGTKNVTLLKNRFKVEIAIWRARNATHTGLQGGGKFGPASRDAGERSITYLDWDLPRQVSPVSQSWEYVS